LTSATEPFENKIRRRGDPLRSPFSQPISGQGQALPLPNQLQAIYDSIILNFVLLGIARARSDGEA
jgi:hypothetical protein